MPSLKQQVKTEFQRRLNRDRTFAALTKKIEKGTATASDMTRYSEHIGKCLGEAFTEILTDDVVPETGITYGFAEDVIGGALREQYNLVVDAALIIQAALNEKNGLNIKAITPERNEDKINGIVERATYDSTFDRDQMRRTLNTSTVNYSMSVADDVVKENISYQNRAGISAKIVRTAVGVKPCEWCKNLAGTYDYGSQPDEVFQRHDNCYCTVEYIPDRSDRSQDVWTKQWSNVQSREREARITAAQEIDREQTAQAEAALAARRGA